MGKCSRLSVDQSKPSFPLVFLSWTLSCIQLPTSPLSSYTWSASPCQLLAESNVYRIYFVSNITFNVEQYLLHLLTKTLCFFKEKIEIFKVQMRDKLDDYCEGAIWQRIALDRQMRKRHAEAFAQPQDTVAAQWWWKMTNETNCSRCARRRHGWKESLVMKYSGRALSPWLI